MFCCSTVGTMSMWEPPCHLPSLFLISAPSSSVPPPASLQHARCTIPFVFYVQSLCCHTRGYLYFTDRVLSLLSLSSLLFFQDTRASCPFSVPLLRQSYSFYSLCTCPPLCLEYSFSRSLSGPLVLPSRLVQTTRVKMSLLFASQN